MFLPPLLPSTCPSPRFLDNVPVITRVNGVVKTLAHFYYRDMFLSNKPVQHHYQFHHCHGSCSTSFMRYISLIVFFVESEISNHVNQLFGIEHIHINGFLIEMIEKIKKIEMIEMIPLDVCVRNKKCNHCKREILH